MTTTDAIAAALLEHATSERGLDQWLAAGDRVGWCEHPIRLVVPVDTVNVTTGEITTLIASSGRGVLAACGNRRASRCLPCSRRYARDTWFLTAGGVSRNDYTPALALGSPAVFLTVTAPSFGAVHSASSSGLPRSAQCSHKSGAGSRSEGFTPSLPVCDRCYRYEELVLWNAHSPRLWARTVLLLKRRLAKQLGVSVRAAKSVFTIESTKAAEFQMRGAVHLHALIRVDRIDSRIGVDQGDLLVAARSAITTASLKVSDAVAGYGLDEIRWGRQYDVRPLVAASPAAGVEAIAVAGYLAKYVTKDIGTVAACSESLPVRQHRRALRDSLEQLASDPDLSFLNLAHRVETLGYPSRPITRSRHYSSTLAALSKKRQEWASSGQQQTDGEHSEEFRFVGSGWGSGGEHAFARQRSQQRVAAEQEAAEQRRAERRMSALADAIVAQRTAALVK